MAIPMSEETFQTACTMWGEAFATSRLARLEERDPNLLYKVAYVCQVGGQWINVSHRDYRILKSFGIIHEATGAVYLPIVRELRSRPLPPRTT